MTCSGVYTALITPFDHKGEIDKKGFCRHISRQKEASVHGLVVLGTTGEMATLTLEEKQELTQLARKEAPRLPLMVGCGSSSTAQTIENIQLASMWGADFALVLSPFYNKPTQEGLFCHFEAISQASPIPIVVYNIPGRTAVNIEVDTLQRIAQLPKICGIKESSGNLRQATDILFTIKKKHPDFSVLCGDDNMTLPFMALGADGVVSGGANLFPHQMVELVRACQQGEFRQAQEINFSLTPLFKALSLETNPIPLKAALELLQLPAGKPRLPLTPLNPKYLPVLKEALQWLNAIPTF